MMKVGLRLILSDQQLVLEIVTSCMHNAFSMMDLFATRELDFSSCNRLLANNCCSILIKDSVT